MSDFSRQVQQQLQALADPGRASGMAARRVALLHQLEWKEHTDEARLFDHCRQCAGEKEFLFREASKHL